MRLSGCGRGRALAGEHHAPTLDRAAGARIDAMVRLMHAAYIRPIGLEELAEAAHMAPSSASRFFRRTTGTTVTAYLNLLRVNAACVLPRDTDRRIADIAADCGYANLSNFNRRFLEIRRVPPSAYRRGFRRAELGAPESGSRVPSRGCARRRDDGCARRSDGPVPRGLTRRYPAALEGRCPAPVKRRSRRGPAFTDTL
ncbi:helix-turn-helix domain-containing protein [Streptomyces sp. NPDC008139]|uniref:helix-turn-helix domain-containing protein n=1 Tax=Streptomyces sp. NPDC008139 TaxID=3364814 RepID=UPI0036EEAA33